MSHITVCRVKIRNPNIQLLMQVFNILSQEYNAVLTNMVRDYYGRVTECLIALAIKSGIGVKIDNQGNLLILGDEYVLGKSLFNEIKDKIIQYYTALAVTQAAQQLGFTIANMQQLENAVIIDIAR